MAKLAMPGINGPSIYGNSYADRSFALLMRAHDAVEEVIADDESSRDDKLKAAEVAVRLNGRVAKLMGLDAPVQVDTRVAKWDVGRDGPPPLGIRDARVAYGELSGGSDVGAE